GRFRAPFARHRARDCSIHLIRNSAVPFVLKQSLGTRATNSMKTKLAIILLLTPSFIIDSYAGSASWNAGPTSNDWNTSTNWTPNTVPNSPTDTATFNVSNQTTLSNLSDVMLEGIDFKPGASAYTIGVSIVLGMNSHASLVFDGSGITNNSGV